jgi:hypothetical protein
VTEGLQRMLFAWGIVMVLFTALLFYRSMLTRPEDDQLLVDETAISTPAREQQALITKLNRMRLLINAMGVVSGVMLLVIVGWAVYLGF